jgi:hypothetical protein
MSILGSVAGMEDTQKVIQALVPAHDPLALSEGFCPECLVSLTGPAMNYCRSCHAWWYQQPGVIAP